MRTATARLSPTLRSWTLSNRHYLPVALGPRRHAAGVCIFVYVGAERPLESTGEVLLRLTKVKSRREKSLLDEEHVYLASGRCACALTLDGADNDCKAERQALLDALSAFLTAATVDGQVRTLVTDGGRQPPREVAVSVAQVQCFDFDSAWDAPSLLTVSRW